MADTSEAHRELLSAVLRQAIEESRLPTQAGHSARLWLTQSPVAPALISSCWI
jgi:hypothetical protein